MFAEKIIHIMNQCIINIVDKSLFVAFNQIIEKGSIEVWDIDGNVKPLSKKEVINTNFENLNLPLSKGKYRLEIIMDGQHISKTININ